MSEYQYVAFRAVDAPVSGEDLEFMRQQSGRATITSREFINEFNFGDFRGDAEGMLRRGYDVHLHYASFGTRKIMLRLPHGLPAPEIADRYLCDDSLVFLPDDSGPGGILSIEPYFESGALGEYLALSELVDDLETLRQEIIEGDLRPLYLAALAVGTDDNHDPERRQEPPLPDGMNELTEAQQTLADFLGIDDAMLSVVAPESRPLSPRTDLQQMRAAWLRRQPEEQKDAWLCQLIESADHSVRQSILQQYWQSDSALRWPTTNVDRTLGQILQATFDLHERPAEAVPHKQQASAQTMAPPTMQNAWQQRLATIAANPDPLIRQAHKLINNQRSSDYAEAARLLGDVRDALAGTDRADLAFSEARQLTEKYPHRRALIAALSEHGLLPG